MPLFTFHVTVSAPNEEAAFEQLIILDVKGEVPLYATLEA
jgi:hypothetical protein